VGYLTCSLCFPIEGVKVIRLDQTGALEAKLLIERDYAIKDGAEKAEPRARQNVIRETGMLLSSLTRFQLEVPHSQGRQTLGGWNGAGSQVPQSLARLATKGATASSPPWDGEDLEGIRQLWETIVGVGVDRICVTSSPRLVGEISWSGGN